MDDEFEVFTQEMVLDTGASSGFDFGSIVQTTGQLFGAIGSGIEAYNKGAEAKLRGELVRAQIAGATDVVRAKSALDTRLLNRGVVPQYGQPQPGTLAAFTPSGLAISPLMLIIVGAVVFLMRGKK